MADLHSPPTGKALRSQIELLQIAEGYFASSVLFSLLKLKVFEALGAETRTADELAVEAQASPAALQRLLNAGVVLGILGSDDGVRYQIVPQFVPLLSPGTGDTYLADWLRNMDFFRDAVSRLDEAVRTDAPTVDPLGHLGADSAQTSTFTLAMHNYASLRGRELAMFLDVGRAKSLLDLGCGPGTYAFSLGMANPGLELFLLDLPDVLDVTREVEERYQLSNPINYLPIDVTRDEIPGSYDLVLVSNTLHMLGESASRDLIARLYATVAQGGSLVIQAQYLRDDRLGGRWPVLLDLIQLCITEDGRNHSVGETKTWLTDAGFTEIEFNAMGLLNTNSFLRGYKN